MVVGIRGLRVHKYVAGDEAATFATAGLGVIGAAVLIRGAELVGVPFRSASRATVTLAFAFAFEALVGLRVRSSRR